MLTTGEGPQEQGSRRRVLSKMLRIEWLGQTVASGRWICSVFSYGVQATGDWLQLFAASAWLVANIAALAEVEPEVRVHGGG